MGSCLKLLSKHWKGKFLKVTQIYWCIIAAGTACYTYGVSDRSEQRDLERLEHLLYYCF